MTVPTTETPFEDATDAREQARTALLPSETRSSGKTNWDGFVSFMRRGLPVAAAMLAVLTIGWPLLNDTEVSFTLSKEEVEKSDGIIRMTNLSYTGTDAIDRKFTVTAATGMQDDPTVPRVKLSDIRATMDVQDDVTASITSETASTDCGKAPCRLPAALP